MDAEPIKLEWRYLKVRRETPVDASGWREFIFVSADMYEVTVAVLVPEGTPGTKRVGKKRRPRVG